jgi:excisionase family DNA binding protein
MSNVNFPLKDVVFSPIPLSDLASALLATPEMKAIIESKTINDTATKYIDKKLAAKEIGVSVPMIDKLLINGRLEKIKVGAKVLITRESIDRLCQVRTNKKSYQ